MGFFSFLSKNDSEDFDFSTITTNGHFVKIFKTINISPGIIKDIFYKVFNVFNHDKLFYDYIRLEIIQLIFCMSCKLMQTNNVQNATETDFNKIWYEGIPNSSIGQRNKLTDYEWALFTDDRNIKYNRNFLKIKDDRFSEKYVVDAIENLTIYIFSIVFREKLLNVGDECNETEEIKTDVLFYRFKDSIKMLTWKIMDIIIMPRVLQINNVIVVMPKSLKEVIDYVDKNVLIIGSVWDWNNHCEKTHISDTEEEEISFIVDYLEKTKWNIDYPSFDLAKDCSPIEANIYQKEYEIKCAKVRDYRLKYLVAIYERYYNKKLKNPKKYIFKPGDDFLLDVCGKCMQAGPGRLHDGMNFVLTEEQYYKYFVTV
jgi:hypothetical protein